MMAAKGLLSLYREVGAELLHKRDRGKDAAMGIRAGTIKEQRYGEETKSAAASAKPRAWIPTARRATASWTRKKPRRTGRSGRLRVIATVMRRGGLTSRAMGRR
jgi:hypothetical protein